jgi:hypothetical protein
MPRQELIADRELLVAGRNRGPLLRKPFLKTNDEQWKTY